MARLSRRLILRMGWRTIGQEPCWKIGQAICGSPPGKASAATTGSAVYTDADRLRRVVMNLLSNAIKFTERGEVLLSVRSLTDGIELAVADTGRGIPPEDLPFIFEEFRQVEGQEQVAQEGSGLGLAIAKKSVELLGGTIQVESQVGTGTKFSLRIADYEGTQ